MPDLFRDLFFGLKNLGVGPRLQAGLVNWFFRLLSSPSPSPFPRQIPSSSSSWSISRRDLLHLSSNPSSFQPFSQISPYPWVFSSLKFVESCDFIDGRETGKVTLSSDPVKIEVISWWTLFNADVLSDFSLRGMK